MSKTFLRALDYYLQSVNTFNYNLSKPLRNLHIFTHLFISLTAYLKLEWEYCDLGFISSSS